MKKLLLPVLATSLVLGGCTWVKLTEAGDNVAVLEASEVGNCIRVGETTASVVDRVVFRRSPEKVRMELQTLARNAAAERAGDTIVPISEVEEGERDYEIYRCRQ